jgi:hypothetical protein
MVSKSGYIITEIYIEIKRAIECKDYERICFFSAELVCSGQIKQLVSWLICLICNQYVSTNLFMLDKIVHNLNFIESQKYKWKSEDVREYICETLLLVSNEELNTSRFYKQNSRYKTFINSLYIFKNKTFRELHENLGYIPHNEVYILICYMYDFILQNDIRSVFKIMYEILAKNNIDECETLDIVSDIKRNKNDAVWVLWKILFITTLRPVYNDTMRNYINRAFQLFSMDYSKKVRNDRLNILFICYVLVVKQKEIVYMDTMTDIITQSTKQVSGFYNEILRNEIEDTNVKNKVIKKKVTETKQEVKVNKSNVSEEQKRDMDHKLKYFFVLTYKNNHQRSSDIFPKKMYDNSDYKILDIDETYEETDDVT